MIAQAELTENECCFDYGDPIRVGAAVLTDLPTDLYIPPDALKVFLEAFEGPLDLLLYLIRKHNIDILDIPMADITRQYMIYVDIMKECHLELAADLRPCNRLHGREVSRKACEAFPLEFEDWKAGMSRT